MTAPVNAETVNIDATRRFLTSLGEHLSSQLSARVSTARATLTGRRTDTATLAILDRIHAHIAAMAATCESGVEHLDAYHGSLEQAVNATPEAADTDFYRPGSTGGDARELAAPTADEQGQEPEPAEPNDGAADEDEDAAFGQAAAFITATTSSHPQQAPPGQDLQHRPAEGYDDDEQPWMSLPVRGTNVCEHVDTVCRECLESWSWGHELRVAEVPTAVDLDEHRSTADEFYVFEGDSERRLPSYWVARHDRLVTSQIVDRPVTTTLLADGNRARAKFAGECCDTTPSGPGAPRAGDRIEISGKPDTGIGAVTVSSSTTRGNGYAIKGTDENGLPYEGFIDSWDYEIVYRPTQQPAAPETQPAPQKQPNTMDLGTLTPGDRVTAYGSVWLYAGTHNDDAVLVEDLRADLDYGYTGHPENGWVTATATATQYRAVLASAPQLSRG